MFSLLGLVLCVFIIVGRLVYKYQNDKLWAIVFGLAAVCFGITMVQFVMAGSFIWGLLNAALVGFYGSESIKLFRGLSVK